MSDLQRPGADWELQFVIAGCAERRLPIEIVGSGSKRAVGRPVARPPPGTIGHLRDEPGELGSIRAEDCRQRSRLEVSNELAERLDGFLDTGFVAAHLILDDVRGQADAARVDQEQVVLQLIEDVLTEPQAVHDDAIRFELDVVDASERGRIVVLPAPGDAHVGPLDLVGELRDLIVGQREALPVHQEADQDDHHRRA